MTAVRYLLALAKTHKAVPCTAFTIAGSTETRHIIKVNKPFHNFIESTSVADIKLSGIVFLWFFLYVTADTGT